MRRIMIPLLATVWLAAGCGDTGYDVSQTPTFEITSADVEYSAWGGKGTITLDIAPGYTYDVTSEKPWCKIMNWHGGTIEIEVEPHGSLQSRESELTITRGDYTRRIGIFQNGTRFHIAGEPGSAVEATPDVLGFRVGESIKIPFVVDGNVHVTVKKTPAWAAAEWARDTLFVTATEIGTWINPRSGTVELEANGIPKKVTITQAERQLEYDSFIGTYRMDTYAAGSSTTAPTPLTIENVTIEANVEGESFLIKGVGSNARYSIPAQYEEGSIKFYVGTLVGQYTTGNVPYDVKVRLVTDAGGSVSTTSYYVYSTYDIVDDKLELTLNVNKGTSSTAYTGFGFYYLYTPTNTTYQQGRYVKEIKLYKQ